MFLSFRKKHYDLPFDDTFKMYRQKGGRNVSFISKKIKKQNVYPCKFQKKLKVPPFHCHKCADQKYL